MLSDVRGQRVGDILHQSTDVFECVFGAGRQIVINVSLPIRAGGEYVHHSCMLSSKRFLKRFSLSAFTTVFVIDIHITQERSELLRWSEECLPRQLPACSCTSIYRLCLSARISRSPYTLCALESQYRSLRHCMEVIVNWQISRSPCP